MWWSSWVSGVCVTAIALQACKWLLRACAKAAKKRSAIERKDRERDFAPCRPQSWMQQLPMALQRPGKPI